MLKSTATDFPSPKTLLTCSAKMRSWVNFLRNQRGKSSSLRQAVSLLQASSLEGRGGVSGRGSTASALPLENEQTMPWQLHFLSFQFPEVTTCLWVQFLQLRSSNYCWIFRGFCDICDRFRNVNGLPLIPNCLLTLPCVCSTISLRKHELL